MKKQTKTTKIFAFIAIAMLMLNSLSFAVAADSGGKKSSNSLDAFNPASQTYTDMFTGTLGYSYSIDVPPGINGFQPSLSLSYNHQQASLKGFLGNSWSLSESYVYRDPETTRSNISDDTFYLNLNGAVMKLIYVASEDSYHTEIESYMQIKKSGETWTVKTKDGTTYRFGLSANARMDSNLESYVSMWYLSEIEDTHGNKISYQYIHPSQETAIYPQKITYGSNSINFEYGDLWGMAGYVFDGYRYGTKISQKSLLTSITTKNNGDQIRKYSFVYSDIGTRKFLSSIQLAGKDSAALPPVEFSYYGLDSGWTEDSGFKLPSGVQVGSERDNGVRLVDINGDGLTDILRMNNSDNLEYWINNGNGWNAKQVLNNFFSGGFSDSDGNDRGVRFVDINSDAKTDIIRLIYGTENTREVILNTGSGWIRSNYSIPVTGFVKRDSSCTPLTCPEGTTEQGTSCSSGRCDRQCLVPPHCSDDWASVFSDYDISTHFSGDDLPLTAQTSEFTFCDSGNPSNAYDDYKCTNNINYTHNI